jgi:hypothetical protein
MQRLYEDAQNSSFSRFKKKLEIVSSRPPLLVVDFG